LEVENDTRQLGVRVWWSPAMNREEQRKLLEEVITLYEMYSHEE
jgi:hypothetical protein